MDDLIGGLFVLMAMAFVVAIVIAAAVTVFAAGATGGALLGLGQGTAAFTGNLGKSMASRGHATRQPRPPEPAYELYVLSQLWRDVWEAFRQAWSKMQGFKASCNRFADRYNQGVTMPLAVGVIAGGAVAPIFGAVLGLIIALPILFVIGVLIVSTWVLVGILRLAEGIRQKVRHASYECPHDHERFPLPVYVCPACSAEHKELVPGRWGILHRECACGTVALPTMVLNGRQKVPQRCPSGHPMAGMIGFAEILRFAVVAGPRAGKTTYLSAAMLEFEQIASEQRMAISALEESRKAYDELVGGLRTGTLPAQTQISGNPALLAEVQGGGRSKLLYAYDVSGESYSQGDEIRTLSFLEVPSGLILLIDPLSIRHVAEQHGEKLEAMEDAVRPSPEEPIRVVERTIGALVEGGAKPENIPVAVVISKTDAFSIGDEIDALEDANHDPARVWLESHGAGNLVRSIEAEFSRIKWFSCSALGRIPSPDDSRPFEPRGAVAPLLWLLEQRGVVPAAEPFEASRVAEQLKAGEAASFAH